MAKIAVTDSQRAQFAGRLLGLIPGAEVIDEGRHLAARWNVGAAGCVLSAHGEASTCRIEIDGADHDLVARLARAFHSER